VVKRIPVGAGLGGGSSDAARAIRLLRLHWDLDPLFRIQSSRDRAWLTRVMARVGSDVPFFFQGGTQLATGRGDVLRPLGDLRGTWVVVLTPPFATDGKTARMYTLLSARHYTDGSRSVGLAKDLDGSPPRRIEESDIYNVFDEVAPMAFPEIGWYRERLGGATGRPVHLCGAGPSLFALCPGAAAAHQAARALRGEGHTAWAMQVIARETVRR
jgi:4-diphosphocytidyl-2-C-methyl-D-erythritol kinase